jgi:hypothetical protein
MPLDSVVLSFKHRDKFTFTLNVTHATRTMDVPRSSKYASGLTHTSHTQVCVYVSVLLLRLARLTKFDCKRIHRSRTSVPVMAPFFSFARSTAVNAPLASLAVFK